MNFTSKTFKIWLATIFAAGVIGYIGERILTYHYKKEYANNPLIKTPSATTKEYNNCFAQWNPLKEIVLNEGNQLYALSTPISVSSLNRDNGKRFHNSLKYMGQGAEHAEKALNAYKNLESLAFKLDSLEKTKDVKSYLNLTSRYNPEYKGRFLSNLWMFPSFGFFLHYLIAMNSLIKNKRKSQKKM